jgi:hypothetical protein
VADGKEGHNDEARTMLAEIYNWFTEGFDTADLKDAKGLLDEIEQLVKTAAGEHVLRYRLWMVYKQF